MKLDLHMHTTCSDGDTSPLNLLHMCSDVGLNLISITDHDTLDAYLQLFSEPIPANMLLMPGVELTVCSDVDGSKHHLLVYFPLLTRGDQALINNNLINKIQLNQYTQQFLNYANYLSIQRIQQLTANYYWAENYFQKLNEVYSLNLDFIDFCSVSKINIINKTSENVIGRPLIAKYLTMKGIVANSSDAFKKYLSDSSPAYQALPKTSMEDNIKQVKKIGGVCFLAHPGIWGYTEEQVQKHIQSAQAAGLDGIEKYHSQQTYACEGVVSRGSDFHGPSVKADTFLNVTQGNLTETEENTLIDRLFGQK
ncbi:Metal-dependent_phosphoesterase [Hexamita inflata]|uniref:Metal-dependent phosphoesterase n=1 Tax=Hexamita inflata TaxID=28002 RepID=A0AA86U2H0_9EUKA|nr:Metal-dependent phosphoesterase [Hexamita inflata]